MNHSPAESTSIRCLAHALLCALAVFVAPAASGADAPPWQPRAPSQVPTTLHTVPARAVILGPLRILLGRTRLTDLYKDSVIPEIRHAGDAGDSLSWGCLTVATRDGLVIARPDSGEMGGDDAVIGVEMERAPKNWPPYGTAACPTRTGRNETAVVTLDDGIRFGASRASVIAALGRPSLSRVDLLDYRYLAPVPHCPRCEGIEGDIAFRFAHGVMTALEITQISVGE